MNGGQSLLFHSPYKSLFFSSIFFLLSELLAPFFRVKKLSPTPLLWGLSVILVVPVPSSNCVTFHPTDPCPPLCFFLFGVDESIYKISVILATGKEIRFTKFLYVYPSVKNILMDSLVLQQLL